MDIRAHSCPEDFGRPAVINYEMPAEWRERFEDLAGQIGKLQQDNRDLHARLDEYSTSFAVLININWTWFAAAKAETLYDLLRFNTQRKRDNAFGLIAKANAFDEAQIQQLRPVFNEICDAAKVIVGK